MRGVGLQMSEDPGGYAPTFMPQFTCPKSKLGTGAGAGVGIDTRCGGAAKGQLHLKLSLRS